jgi:hypothetical protein
LGHSATGKKKMIYKGGHLVCVGEKRCMKNFEIKKALGRA